MKMLLWISVYFIYIKIVACALDPPSELRALVTSSNTFHVLWKTHPRDNDRNTTYYTIRFRPNEDDYIYKDTVLSKIEILDALPNTTYEFSVKFNKGRRSSLWSFPVYNQTSGNEITPIISEPRYLRIRHISPGFIKVKWRKPKIGSEEVIGYRLRWRERGNQSTSIVDLPDRSYLVTSLNPGKTYDVWVMAVAGDGRMSNASKLSFINPHKLIMSPPTNITVVAAGSTKLKLTWSSPKRKNRKITNYKIQYRRRGVRRGDLCSVTTHSRKKEYVITDLNKGGTYKVRVAAKTSDGTGKFSKWIIAQTLRKGNKRNKKQEVALPESTTLHDVTTFHDITTEAKAIELNMYVEPISGGVNITWLPVLLDDTTFKITVLRDGDPIKIEDNIVSEHNAVILGLEGNIVYNVNLELLSSNHDTMAVEEATVIPLASLEIKGMEDVHTFAGSNVSLTCVVTNYDDAEIVWIVGDAGDAFPDGSWFMQRQELHFQIETTNTDNNEMLSTLTIVRVSKEDAGTYQCRASDGQYTADGYVNLYVTDPVPGPVTELKADPMSPYKIHLTWGAPKDGQNVHGNVTYKIIYNEDGHPPSSLSGIRELHYILNHLQPSTMYHVVVIAENEYGTSRNAVNKEVTVTTPPMLDPPRLISVKTFNSSTLIVEWNEPNNSDALEYNIKYKPKANTTTSYITVDSGQTTATLYDLEKRQNYEVRIEAVTAEGILTSSWAEASTYPDAYLDETRLPPPPADVFLDVVNYTLYISWLPPHVEYRTLVRWYEAEVFVDGNFLTRLIVEEESRQIQVENIDPGQDHIVYVRALNKIGQSDPIRRIYKPVYDYSDSMVKNLKATPIDATSVLVKWSPPTRRRLTRYLIRHLPLDIVLSKPSDEWLAPSHNNYVLMHLQPYQEYKVSVIPYIDDMEGNVSTVNVRTYSSIPTAPPANFSATIVNNSLVLLSWSSPPSQNQNGEIIAYNLQYKPRHQDSESHVHVTVNASYTSYLVSGLQDGVYRFRISASTVNGTGPATNWSPVSIDTAIKEPPGPPLNFTAEPARPGIRLSWLPPDDTEIPIKGYVVGHGRFIPEVYRRIVGKNKLGVTLRRLRPGVDYIVSVRSFNNYGESKPVIIVARAGSRSGRTTTTTTTPENVDDRPTDVTVTSINQEVVMLRVSWQPPRRPTGQIRGYLVYYKDQNSNSTESWDVKFERSLSYTINNLQFNTTYFIRVQVQYEDAYGGISDIIEYTTPILDTTRNVLPKPEISSVFSGRNYLQITWMPPDAEYIHVIRGYILGYGTHEADEHQEIIAITQKTFQIENLVPGTKYFLSLRVFNELGESDRLLFNASTAAD